MRKARTAPKEKARWLMLLGGFVAGFLTALRMRDCFCLTEDALVGENVIESVSQKSPGFIKRGYEASDVNFALFLGVTVAIAVSALIIHTILWGWTKNLGLPAAFNSPRFAPVETSERTATLQIDPTRDWNAYRSAQHKILSTYGRVDQNPRVIRVPVTVTMEDIAEHGLPDWQSNGAVSALQLQQRRALKGAVK